MNKIARTVATKTNNFFSDFAKMGFKQANNTFVTSVKDIIDSSEVFQEIR